MSTTELIKLIDNEKYKESLEYLNTQCVGVTWNHSDLDKVIDAIIESLDADEPITFTLLNKAIRKYASMQYLLTATDEEKELYGVHNSRSPFDKLLDYYLSLDDDEPKEKRFMKGVLDLIRANIRYQNSYGQTLAEYHELNCNKTSKEEE